MNNENHMLNNSNILIVDDTLANLQVLSEMLRKQGYKVRPAPSGQLALDAAHSDPPDLILLDINMPGMNGYEVCMKLKEDDNLKKIPVIFLSALSELSDKLQAFTVGGVDYITKPFQFEEVQVRVKTHLELYKYQNHLEELVQAQVKEISESQMATIFSLAKLAESRDEDTGTHLERVQEFCRMLAIQLCQNSNECQLMNTDFINNLYHVSPLHDIGKVGISDLILLKPGRHTPEEFEIMKQHTVIGADTLEAARSRYPQNTFITMGISIARSHHEKWDGSGYPDGLAGNDIPLVARIMALADVYDALRSKRCYKEAFTHEHSREIIVNGKGKHFDPDIVDAFLSIENEFDRIRTEMDDD